jgi:hypothetical protein
MNYEQAMSLLRTCLQIAGTLAVSRGWVSAEQAAALTDQLIVLAGAAAVIGATIWGLVARSKKNLVASAAALPEVKKMLTEPEIAKAVPSAKVTSSY